MGSTPGSLGEIRAALETSSEAGTPILVLVESVDGLAGGVRDLIPEDLKPVRRAVGAKATQAKVGCVADTLDLDNYSGGVIVVENAQWADPTSMGRLQRLLSDEVSDPLVVVAHTPPRSEDRWWLDQLAVAGQQRGTVLRTEADPEEAAATPSDERERDLVLAAGMVSVPISVPVAAALADSTEAEALEVAERLVARGLLTETRSGFQPTPAGLSVEAGEARRGHLAARLASVLAESGEDPSVVGALLVAAGNPGSAYPHLREAAMRAETGGAGGEAYHVAVAALAAAEDAGVGTRDELGELHLACGRFLASGRSEEAVDHLDQAVALLDGPARIDALGFSAAVADNRQLPQDSERILAVAEWEAANQGELAKLGSLGTFRALELNRIGFSREADALLEKSSRLIAEHGTETQRFNGVRNRAWIAFDRGQVTQAETEFSRLRDLTDKRDLAGLADRDAWLARCLFATGHPREALEAVDSARRLATEAEVEAPLFLADLALVEGCDAFGLYQESLEAADRVRDLVERQLPSWRNIAHFGRGRALFRLGREDEARAEIEAALDATPPGANGWRWRSRCQALQMEMSLGDRSFPKRDAEDLADVLFQAELYGWAAELKVAIAEQTNDTEAAREAMALAVYLGNPMLAARAAHAGKLWKDPTAAPAIRSIRAIGERLPDGWEDTWNASPIVTAAMSAPEPRADVEGEAENLAVLEDTLAGAGLTAADGVLSPAQRRTRGLVRHRRRRLSPLALAAAALAVVVLAGGTAFAVSQLAAPEVSPPATVVVEVPVTEPVGPPGLEETPILLPDEISILSGRVDHRGGNARSGFIGQNGPIDPSGFYWRSNTGERIEAAPVTEGQWIYVATSPDGVLHAFNQVDGSAFWTMPTGSQIRSTPALGEVTQEGEQVNLVVVGDTAGVVHGRDSRDASGIPWTSDPLGGEIRSSPVLVDGMVYVATTAGFVHAISADLRGAEIWRYPEEGAGIGSITADLAYHDGYLYVGSPDGLHVIDVATREGCDFVVGEPIVVNPVVTDETVYLFTRGKSVFAIPPGTCAAPLTPLTNFALEDPMDFAPALHEGVIYLPFGRHLYAIDVEVLGAGFVAGEQDSYVWPIDAVSLGANISTPPVVTENLVLFGSEDGRVYAHDRETGEYLWSWETGRRVGGAPAVVESQGVSVAYIVTGDGLVYAVGDGVPDVGDQ